jgi:hypothetical protein
VYPFVVIQIMLKILVYIYNKSVHCHGHKYIKLGKQNKKNEKGGTKGEKNGTRSGPWVGHRRMEGGNGNTGVGTKKGEQEAAEGTKKGGQEAAEEGRDEERCFPNCCIPNRDCSDSFDW